MDLLSQKVEILWMSRFHYKKNSDLTIHKHLYYQIIYFLEGTGRLFLDDEWVTITCPAILVLSPNHQHGIEIRDGLKTIDIKFAVKNQSVQEELSIISGLTKIKGINNIEELLEELLIIGSSKKPLFKERCQLILSVVLLQLLSEKMDSGTNQIDRHLDNNLIASKSPLCRALVKYIENNLEEKIDSHTLESSMGYTYRHISHCTSKELHMSPMQLIQFIRVQKAKELITNNYDLKIVALKTGFQSIYHFTRIFKKQVGTPPGMWKDQQIRDICRGIDFDPDFTNKWNNREIE